MKEMNIYNLEKKVQQYLEHNKPRTIGALDLGNLLELSEVDSTADKINVIEINRNLLKNGF